MILVGIDDTDIIGTPGTNQLARAILKGIGEASRGAVICRHQLFFDPRVPYTSKNGSASIQLPHAAPEDIPSLARTIREIMAKWFVEGSDPGLCIAAQVPDMVREYALSCKTRVVAQEEAYHVAEKSGCYLIGLGGTNQGVVGALAAIGLISSGDDGRVVHLDFWTYPEDTFSGPRAIDEILERGVAEVRDITSGEAVTEGQIDVGRHLRPNWRGKRIVLYVESREPAESSPRWRAVKVL